MTAGLLDNELAAQEAVAAVRYVERFARWPEALSTRARKVLVTLGYDVSQPPAGQGTATGRTRTYRCCCCGQDFRDSRPQNPQRDRGYGTCERCRTWVRERERGGLVDPHAPGVPHSMLDKRYA